jgi:hypothetical protein
VGSNVAKGMETSFLTLLCLFLTASENNLLTFPFDLLACVAVALGLGGTEGQSISEWFRFAYDKVFFLFFVA